MTTQIIICACHSAEHQILFYFDPEVGYNDEAYLLVHLSQKSFWKRLKYAFKYVLGYKSRYGAWDEMILTKEHLPVFQEIVDTLDRKIPNT